MIRASRLVIFIILSSTVLFSQEHKLGGKLSFGISPFAFGIGATYSYKVSSKMIIRGLLEAEFINGERQNYKLYLSDNFYTNSLSCQLLFKPFKINEVFYIGIGGGYYIITGDNIDSHGGSIDNAYIKEESFSNSVGFDIILGTELSDNWALDFSYRILVPIRTLEIYPYDGSPIYTEEERLNIHLISVYLVFTFSL